ncbi:UDP-N-acetylmuramoyl-tripeptide--D-alanyl-D-alanine ligase [Aerococcus viridans]|uniref:UDP-N-acetylmuramoyl-tripeptide--D-alanyl-D-alanine ligase n=1 Tax=Aerococcus viridans TaxID=1377 RepID=A0A2J9PLQ0_9LACT|nr:UDP-N-acetylmuramoyl-tripeptide--D-alanyl-D-alanine ligase [Aerococcus viridans]MCT1798663.1 UDP-N-acetylmuramoyl-tripeptide--D-alanyl-D-alanine ligase [Aerococcus viridans]PNL91283.1 UDP-N-acetylmuramoyl-tripeptide--D-alanyl-D-alanine ligase [Aerococcus viridans]
MKPTQIKDIVKVVDAIDFTSTARFTEIDSVEFDSRLITPGALFVPLKGVTDGHSYIDKAIENGAVAALWSNDPNEAPVGFPIIQVEDTLVAMQAFAKAYLGWIKPKVVGITGSSGKTTTKDMTAAALSTALKVHKTNGNYNNDIGLPKTILDMPEDTDVIVLEMGMSGAGEISFLSKLAEPDVVVITMIGENHIEFLGSRENIAKAKLEILDGLKEEGTFIYPGDEPLIVDQMPADLSQSTLTIGLNEDQDIFAFDVMMDQFQSTFFTNLSPELKMEIPLSGGYNVQNALYALGVAYSFGLSMEQVQPHLAEFSITADRGSWERGILDTQILNDTYNASPSAMKAVIRNFSAISSKGMSQKILVLGDMLELGAFSDELHKEIATVIGLNTFKHVFLYGPRIHPLVDALVDKGMHPDLITYIESDKEALIEEVKAILQPEDKVLVKASNGMGLIEVVEALRIASPEE